MYGITVPVDETDPAMTDDLSAIAESYATELERRFPTGPIGLLGMSIGGLIAFDVARRLHERGRTISLLGAIDTAGPDGSRHQLRRSERWLLQARRSRSVGARVVFGDWVDYQRIRISRYGERIEHWVRSSLGMRLSRRLVMRQIVERNIVAMRSFELRPADLAITVFKGADDPFSQRLVANDMGWAEVAAGGVTVALVPGEHLTIVEEPNVAALADAVRRALHPPISP